MPLKSILIQYERPLLGKECFTKSVKDMEKIL